MMTREELVRACNEAHETAKRLTAPVPQARYVEWLRALKLEAKKIQPFAEFGIVSSTRFRQAGCAFASLPLKSSSCRRC